MNKRLFKELQSIAKFYGANLKSDQRCFYDDDTKTVHVDFGHPKDLIISAFFHEIAHHINYTEGNYPLYHSKEWDRTKLNRRLVAYGHRAELFTDKIGKKLAKLWYPKVRYHCGYKAGDPKSLWYLYGYYMV